MTLIIGNIVIHQGGFLNPYPFTVFPEINAASRCLPQWSISLWSLIKNYLSRPNPRAFYAGARVAEWQRREVGETGCYSNLGLSDHLFNTQTSFLFNSQVLRRFWLLQTPTKSDWNILRLVDPPGSKSLPTPSTLPHHLSRYHRLIFLFDRLTSLSPKVATVVPGINRQKGKGRPPSEAQRHFSFLETY